MPVYKGESIIPSRDTNLMSLFVDNNTNILSTNLIVSNDLFFKKKRVNKSIIIS